MSPITDGVAFEFYAFKKRSYVLSGRVETVNDQMTLFVSIPEDLYIVKGQKRDDGTFEGRHEETEEEYGVLARWALLGDVYVGTWQEADEHSIFAFRLPSPLEHD